MQVARRPHILGAYVPTPALCVMQAKGDSPIAYCLEHQSPQHQSPQQLRIRTSNNCQAIGRNSRGIPAQVSLRSWAVAMKRIVSDRIVAIGQGFHAYRYRPCLCSGNRRTSVSGWHPAWPVLASWLVRPQRQLHSAKCPPRESHSSLRKLPLCSPEETRSGYNSPPEEADLMRK